MWTILQTVGLISHLPLLNVNMPGSSAIVLSETAKVLRLDFVPLSAVFDSLDVGSANTALNSLMHQNGYKSTAFLLNVTPLIALYLLLCLLSLITKCADTAHITGEDKKAKPTINGRTDVRHLSASQKMLNAFFRFIFMTLLEFLIAIFIDLKAVSRTGCPLLTCGLE